jgi:hypothetical protein
MKKILLALGIVLILLVFLWLMAIPSAPRPKVRGVVPEAHEAKPPDATKRFGGGVIRKNEKPVDEE